MLKLFNELAAANVYIQTDRQIEFMFQGAPLTGMCMP